MIRRSAALIALLSAAACTPSVPDSGAGVGFQDYNTYIHNSTVPPAGAAAAPLAPAAAPAAGFDPAAASAAIDRASGVTPPAPAAAAAGTVYTPPVAADGARPRGNAPAGIKEESGEMAHANTGISDEQDFTAVAARETIASDKERIEQNRAQYVVVQPKDLPVRPGDTGPNIADYALKTTNDPGTALYHRSGSLRNSANSCAKFSSPDLAQQAFLAKGGPDRDRLNLDPDGDGFACGWDPRPFRKALQ